MSTVFYIADTGNLVIRQVDAAGIITTPTLTSTDANYIANGGFLQPTALAFDPAGNLYVVDNFAPLIYKIDTNLNVTTFAGMNGQFGFSGDGGPATSATFNNPQFVATDSVGNVYISDPLFSIPNNITTNVIRVINTQVTPQTLLGQVVAPGNIQTVAGVPNQYGFSGDGGPATNALLNFPQGLKVDVSGNLYIVDSGNSCIRRVDTTGNITTVVGSGTNSGYSGDGGPAASALLNFPEDIAFDSLGNLYIADALNYVVRAVNLTGTTQTLLGISIGSGDIQTVAGNNTFGFSGDGGPATNAQVGAMQGLSVDLSGNVIFTNSVAAIPFHNSIIREVSTAGVINTIAGTGIVGYSGDGGPATNAELQGPDGVAFFLPIVPQTGNIVVTKATVPPGSSQVFTFTPSWGPPFTLTDGQSNDSGPLVPGTYSVAETNPNPFFWVVTTSTDPNDLVVVGGQTTNITFTNTQTTCGPILVVNGNFQNALGQPLADGKLTVRLDSDAMTCDQKQLCAGIIASTPLDSNGNVVPFYLYPQSNLSSGVRANIFYPSDFYEMIAYAADGQRCWQSRVQVVGPGPFDLNIVTPQE